MFKQEELKILHEKWLAQCACPLKSQCTQGVPGHGNAEAEIVFIGEAPGRNEDFQGKPFVGQAGKFLNEMLINIDLKREGVYITNVLKYRPPDNRDPLPEEISACLPWLAEEVNLIDPKLIVFLGRHALNTFFPQELISRAHGKLLIKNIPGWKCEKFLALYHPAAALHNGSLRDTLVADFQKIPKALQKIADEKTVASAQTLF